MVKTDPSTLSEWHSVTSRDNGLVIISRVGGSSKYGSANKHTIQKRLTQGIREWKYM